MKTEYHLTIRALPDPTPADVRMRAMLKTLKRFWRFECVRVTESEVEEKGKEPSGKGK